MKNNKKLLKTVQAWILVVMALTVTPCSYAAVSPVTQALQDERAVLEGWSVALGNLKGEIEQSIAREDRKAKQIHQELRDLDNEIGKDRVVFGLGGGAKGLFKEARDVGNLDTDDGSGQTHKQHIETLRRQWEAINTAITTPATLIPASVTKLIQVKAVKANADRYLRDLRDLKVAVEARKARIQGLTPLQQAQAILRPVQALLADGGVDTIADTLLGRAGETVTADLIFTSNSSIYKAYADNLKGIRKVVAGYQANVQALEQERALYRDVVAGVVDRNDANQLDRKVGSGATRKNAFTGATRAEKANDLVVKVRALQAAVTALKAETLQVATWAGDLSRAYDAMVTAQALVANGGQADTRLQEMITFNADGRHTDDTHKITGIDLTAAEVERQRLRDAIAAKLAEAQNVEKQDDAQKVAREAQDLDRQVQALAARVGAEHALLDGNRRALAAAVGAAADVARKIQEAKDVITDGLRDLVKDGGDIQAILNGQLSKDIRFIEGKAQYKDLTSFTTLHERAKQINKARNQLKRQIGEIDGVKTQADLLRILGVASLDGAKAAVEGIDAKARKLERDVQGVARELAELKEVVTAFEAGSVHKNLQDALAIIGTAPTDADTIRKLVSDAKAWNTANAAHQVRVAGIDNRDDACGFAQRYDTYFIPKLNSIKAQGEAQNFIRAVQALLRDATAKRDELQQAQAVAEGQRDAGAIKARVERALTDLQRRLDAVTDASINKDAANAALQEVRRLLAAGDPAKIVARADVAGVVRAAQQADAKLADAGRAVAAVEAAEAAAGVAEAERRRLEDERLRLQGVRDDLQRIKDDNTAKIQPLRDRLTPIALADKTAALQAITDYEAAVTAVNPGAIADPAYNVGATRDALDAAHQAAARAVAEAAEAAERERLRREDEERRRRDAAEAERQRIAAEGRRRDAAATTLGGAFKGLKARRELQRLRDEREAEVRRQETIRQARLLAQGYKADGLRLVDAFVRDLETAATANPTVSADAALRAIGDAQVAVNGINIDTAINDAATADGDAARIRGQVAALVQRAQEALGQFRDAADAERLRLEEAARRRGGGADLGGTGVRRYGRRGKR